MRQERFNPEMLSLAREYRNMNQTELSEASGISQSIISRLENGSLNITEDHAVRLSKVLDMPRAFFAQADKRYGLGNSFLFHRKRQSMRVKDLRQVEATMNVSMMQIRRLISGVTAEYDYHFHPMEVGVDGSPEEIASLLRASWELPSGPISDLTACAERAGAIVVRLPFSSPKVDGLSVWPSDLPPLIFLNVRMPSDRDRWTMAHEIAHLIMHRHVHQEIESEADRFASEFLMPAKQAKPQLSRMSLAKAAQMKTVWRVSMQAIIRRAKDLGAITPRQYRYLMVQMGKSGYRLQEPNAFPKEEATNLSDILRVHAQLHGYTSEELISLVNAPPNEFRRFYYPNENGGLRIAQ